MLSSRAEHHSPSIIPRALIEDKLLEVVQRADDQEMGALHTATAIATVALPTVTGTRLPVPPRIEPPLLLSIPSTRSTQARLSLQTDLYSKATPRKVLVDDLPRERVFGTSLKHHLRVEPAVAGLVTRVLLS